MVPHSRATRSRGARRRLSSACKACHRPIAAGVRYGCVPRRTYRAAHFSSLHQHVGTAQSGHSIPWCPGKASSACKSCHRPIAAGVRYGCVAQVTRSVRLGMFLSRAIRSLGARGRLKSACRVCHRSIVAGVRYGCVARVTRSVRLGRLVANPGNAGPGRSPSVKRSKLLPAHLARRVDCPPHGPPSPPSPP